MLSIGSTILPNDIPSEMVELCDDDMCDNMETGESLLSPENIFNCHFFMTRLLRMELGSWHLHAASNILKCPIVSVYPDRGPQRQQYLMKRAYIIVLFILTLVTMKICTLCGQALVLT